MLRGAFFVVFVSATSFFACIRPLVSPSFPVLGRLLLGFFSPTLLSFRQPPFFTPMNPCREHAHKRVHLWFLGPTDEKRCFVPHRRATCRVGGSSQKTEAPQSTVLWKTTSPQTHAHTWGVEEGVNPVPADPRSRTGKKKQGHSTSNRKNKPPRKSRIPCKK